MRGRAGNTGASGLCQLPREVGAQQSSFVHWAGSAVNPHRVRCTWRLGERRRASECCVLSGDVGSATGVFLRWLIYTEWGSWDLLINCRKRESWWNEGFLSLRDVAYNPLYKLQFSLSANGDPVPEKQWQSLWNLLSSCVLFNQTAGKWLLR